ncbi:MAG: hypothetical protein DI603_07925 [Roseateles depolymerans]|uniref:Ice-binding protein C-terminal domain-containing protein n=1 Tax=Roseateles depolymerans TaxID=76731 RepID=A0A2W5DU38_9BURK|nr:MAG: hypothetical protein DI603_07925 [Roseateles depolymerans]
MPVRFPTARPAVLSLALLALGGGGSALAQTVGSASLATLRSCGSAEALEVCDGSGAGQGVVMRQYGGGVGYAGANDLDGGGGNVAHSFVSFGDFDLPLISGWTSAPGDVRMNVNVFGFQSYRMAGTGSTPFSVAGTVHIVDSSSNAGGAALPGGASLTAYVGIWDAAILAGYGSDAQSLFAGLFYAPCGTPGVRGVGFLSLNQPGGEQSYTLSTSACSSGSLDFAPGEELLVVAGLQLPVNRGGFVDASHTFTTQLDPLLGDAALTQIAANAQSAIAQGATVTMVPEPAALWLFAAGLLGLAAGRRRSGVHRL